MVQVQTIDNDDIPNGEIMSFLEEIKEEFADQFDQPLTVGFLPAVDRYEGTLGANHHLSMARKPSLGWLLGRSQLQGLIRIPPPRDQSITVYVYDRRFVGHLPSKLEVLLEKLGLEKVVLKVEQPT